MLGEEEDIEGKHTFNLQEKLESVKFDRDFVQEMQGKGILNICFPRKYPYITYLHKCKQK